MNALHGMRMASETKEQIPHSPETERTVLGMLLYDSEAAKEIIGRLKPDSFYTFAHRLVFEAAVRAYDDTGTVDALQILAQVKVMGKPKDAVGGLSGIMELGEEIATTKHLDYHVQQLLEYQARRQLIDLHRTALHELTTKDLPATDSAEATQRGLAEIGLTNGDRHWWRGVKFLSWTQDELRWIVEPFIAAKDVFFLSSDAGVGKTWFLSALMLQVATGRPWLGRFTTTPTRCLYCDFDGHGDGDALRIRLQRLASGLQLEPPFKELEDRFGVMTRYHLPQAFNLYKGDNIGQFKHQVQQGGFQLVIIDTFSAVHGSDNENDAGKMAICMNRLRQMAYETGAAFAIAHHHRKESQLGQDSTGSRYRGATSIKAGADSMLEMRREHSGIIRLSHGKPRHVKALEDFAASMNDGGDGIVVQCEDSDKLSGARRDDAVKWILTDLWKLPQATQGWLPQPEIIRLAKENSIASDKYVREALGVLDNRGLIQSKPGSDYGLHTNTKVWLPKAQELPFD